MSLSAKYSRGQKISIFVAATSASRATGAAYLKASDWKLQQAINHYNADQEDDS